MNTRRINQDIKHYSDHVGLNQRPREYTIDKSRSAKRREQVEKE